MRPVASGRFVVFADAGKLVKNVVLRREWGGAYVSMVRPGMAALIPLAVWLA